MGSHKNDYKNCINSWTRGGTVGLGTVDTSVLHSCNPWQISIVSRQKNRKKAAKLSQNNFVF